MLRLIPGQTIQAVDGSYTPQTEEVWHSDARYRALERQLIDTAAALAQERARNTTH